MNLTAFGLASLIGMATTAPVAAAEPAHPTIRHMAGAPVATSLDAAKTAVLVIDFQNEYFDATAAPGFAGGRMVIPDGVAALRQAKRVVEFADAHGIRVIHVQHVLPAGAPLFAQGSVNAAFHRDLQPRQGETVVQKDNVSVFAGASSTVLDPLLKNAGIDTLIVTGLQTHACVAGAARDAAAAPSRRAAERVRGSLDDQHGHRDRTQLVEPALLRATGRVQREREAKHADRAGLGR